MFYSNSLKMWFNLSYSWNCFKYLVGHLNFSIQREVALKSSIWEKIVTSPSKSIISRTLQHCKCMCVCVYVYLFKHSKS